MNNADGFSRLHLRVAMILRITMHITDWNLTE